MELYRLPEIRQALSGQSMASIDEAYIDAYGKLLASDIDDAAFHAYALALPGYTKKDIIIDIDHDVLQISSALEGSSDHLTKMEFSVRPFNRKFQLPESADTDQIAASFKNGVLNLIIPKKEYAKAKPPA